MGFLDHLLGAKSPVGRILQVYGLSPAAAAPSRVIKGEGVSLRPPLPEDYAEWTSLRGRSRNFLVPWEPSWAEEDLSASSYRRRLRRYSREARYDRGYAFFVFRDEDGALVGGCTLSHVQRGVQQCCTLGYWAGEPYAGHGYIKRAVRAIIPFVFDELNLHRLQAACVPENEPSKAVLRGCGFQDEGFMRDYVRINGRWRDHLVFAILRHDPRP